MNFRLSACIFLMVFFSTALFSAPDAVAPIKKNDAEISILLKKKVLSSMDLERLKVLSSGYFNFQKMAEKSLLKNTWTAMDNDTRVKFTVELQKLIQNTTVKKYRSGIFADFATHEFVYDSPIPKDDGAKVFVIKHWVESKNKKNLVDVTYKMDLMVNGFSVYDVEENGVSMMTGYKDEFSAILKTKKVPELITIIKKRADDIQFKK